MTVPPLLEHGELTIVGRLLDASNGSFVATVGPAEGSLRCIYKPIRGERPLEDFPSGTLAARERAAFLLSEACGWRIVPPTVLRDGPFGPGMVQLWVEPDVEVDVLALITGADPRLRRIAIFDVLANNADRKGSHLLPMPDGHIHGIDHGICFAAEPKLRTVLWAWRGQPLAQHELATVRDIAAAMDGELGRALGELLRPAELEAAAGRTAKLLSEGAFPHPDPGRPALPWPPF